MGEPVTRSVGELGTLADANLAGTWRSLGGAGGAVGGHDSLVFAASGLPAPFFNGAYATGPTKDPDGAVRAATEFMKANGVPWLLWVREGLDDALVAACERAGMRGGGGPPGLGLSSIPDAPPLPDGVTMELLADPADLPIHWDLAARGFGMPYEMCQRLMTPDQLADPHFAVAVARVGGEPVATAILSITGTTAGVYTVATPEEHRRRGYGAAVTWAVVTEGRRRGCDHAVLQSSEAGYPIYLAMGFVPIGTYLQFEGPAGAS